MKVRELIEWLSQFQDQDATIEIVEHKSEGGYYQQGGVARQAAFDPEQHATYVDMRGNQFVPENAPYKDSRTLLLGTYNG